MRNTKLVVYGSSYDRGLEHLLEMWADVKKEVPDVQLRIFYGWNLFDVMAKGNPQMQDWKAKMCELMKQDGITELGRISHDAVRTEFENAGIWAYPTHFGEISCITAMKAQAWGAVPVVVNYAALVETVQYGIKVEGDIYDQETKDEFKKQLIALLKDSALQESTRAAMMPWAQSKFPWANVAKQWDEEFRSPQSLEKQIEALMEDNQPLKAWELVKDTSSPLKDRVWLRVKHAFDSQAYKDYYSKELIENPVSEEVALNCRGLAPRFALTIPKILELNPKSFLDLGCADGYMVLTMAKEGVKGVGYNLYQPSVDLANGLAKKHKLEASFKCDDLFNATEKSDVVVMMEVLEHLPDPQKGVDHAMSLLNESGHAFFSTPRIDHVGVEQHKAEPNHEGWDDGKPSGHLRLFTEDEFKGMFKNYKIVDYIVDPERCMIAEVVNV